MKMLKELAFLASEIAQILTIVILFALGVSAIVAMIAIYFSLWLLGLALALPYICMKWLLNSAFKR